MSLPADDCLGFGYDNFPDPFLSNSRKLCIRIRKDFPNPVQHSKNVIFLRYCVGSSQRLSLQPVNTGFIRALHVRCRSKFQVRGNRYDSKWAVKSSFFGVLLKYLDPRCLQLHWGEGLSLSKCTAWGPSGGGGSDCGILEQKVWFFGVVITHTKPV